MSGWDTFLPVEQLGQRMITELMISWFWVFLLVATRVSGLFSVGPLIAHAGIPTQVRMFLTLAISLIVAPVVVHFSAENTESGYSLARVIPSTILDGVFVAGQEFFIGMALGLGVTIIISGIQFAGEMFDQQSGIALAEVYNPMFDGPLSTTSQLLSMSAALFIMCMQPLGGDLLMLKALLQTFQQLPVGQSYELVEVGKLLSQLVHESLVLALKIAAPMLAAQTLISLSLGFLGYSVPQINILVVGFAIRAFISMLILIFTFTGLADVIIEIFPTIMDRLAGLFVPLVKPGG
jgi:flagellar biosynthetic protein FliR